MSVVEKLLALNVNEHTEKKGNLTYLSWAWAWQETLKAFPEATYTVLKNEFRSPAFGSPDIGYMVYTTVTIDGITREMWLPIMDNRNKALKIPDMFDVNKAVMRCLTKNLAMFGLGLYIYAGEDLPEEPPREPSGVETNELITLGAQKGISAGKLEKWLVAKFKYGMEFMTQKEHDTLMEHLNTLPDKE
jgi:hypothetical protein